MKQFLLLLSCFTCTLLNAQKTDERPATHQAGECRTKSSYLFHKESKSAKVFVIDVSEDGNYFLDMFLLVSGTTPYEVLIDDIAPAGVVKSSSNSWQFVSLQDSVGRPKTIPLAKGQHTVSFGVTTPFVPLVDMIALGRTGAGSLLNRKPATDYLEKLTRTKLPADYKPENNTAKSNGRIQSNPEGQYDYSPGYAYQATSTFQYWLQGGLPYVFKTADTNTDPVMYVFHSSDISLGSWSNDNSGGGNNPQISFTPSVSGYYTVFLKAYSSASAGIADFYFNGVKVMDDIPVGGNWYSVTPKSGEINFFTSHVSGSTNLLIAQSETSPILSFNGLYYPWYQYSGYVLQYSRIRGNFSGNAGKVIATSVNMYDPSGTCDLYMNCEMVTNGGMLDDYPNLSTDDAIKTANIDGYYNCIAWAAGISPNGNAPTGFNWNYPINEVIAGYPADDTALGSKDDFFGNNPPRYSGATTYTRSGADYNNAVLALWATNEGHTHVSVRKPGNNHPHGYDWESKMSGDERMMHPRNALAGDQLGQIIAYYRIAPSGGRLSAEKDGVAEGISLQESLDRGLSVMEEQKWSATEMEQLKKWVDAVDPTLQKEFSTVYRRWVTKVNTPAIQSTTDQQSHLKLSEYTELKSWIKQHGSAVLPLLLNEFFSKSTYSIDAILGITMDTYRSLWKEVSEENRTNLYDEQGRYLVRSQSTNCARYIQKILNRLKTDTVTGIELFCSPNPVSTDGVIEFYLPVPVIVSLQINSENGRVITNLMENRSMQAGWQRIYWDGKNKDGSKTQTGIYLITLTTDTQRKTISIVVY